MSQDSSIKDLLMKEALKDLVAKAGADYIRDRLSAASLVRRVMPIDQIDQIGERTPPTQEVLEMRSLRDELLKLEAEQQMEEKS
jgi:hypothetical protein